MKKSLFLIVILVVLTATFSGCGKKENDTGINSSYSYIDEHPYAFGDNSNLTREALGCNTEQPVTSPKDSNNIANKNSKNSDINNDSSIDSIWTSYY